MVKLWQFIKKGTNGTIAQPVKQESAELTTPNLYQSINDISWYNFERCYVNGNLKFLIIDGTATTDQLDACWNKLYEDYVYAIGDNEQKLYLRLYREISELATRIHLIRRLVEILYDYRVSQMADMLNKELNCNFKFDPSKPEEYDRLLQKCYNKSKSLIIQYDLKNSNFKSIEKHQKTGDKKKPTNEYFASVLNALRLANNLPINPKEISAFEFVDLIRATNKKNSK